MKYRDFDFLRLWPNRIFPFYESLGAIACGAIVLGFIMYCIYCIFNTIVKAKLYNLIGFTYIHKMIDFCEIFFFLWFFWSATAEHVLTEVFNFHSSIAVSKYIWMTFISFLLKCNLSVYQANSVPSAHHVVGKDRQQQFQFIRMDVDVGLDCVPWPDGPALKHLGTKSLVWDKIKARKGW